MTPPAQAPSGARESPSLAQKGSDLAAAIEWVDDIRNSDEYAWTPLGLERWDNVLAALSRSSEPTAASPPPVEAKCDCSDPPREMRADIAHAGWCALIRANFGKRHAPLCQTCGDAGTVPAMIETATGAEACPYIGEPCPDCITPQSATREAIPDSLREAMRAGNIEQLRQDLIEAADDVENDALQQYTSSSMPKHVRRREYAMAQANRLRDFATILAHASALEAYADAMPGDGVASAAGGKP